MSELELRDSLKLVGASAADLAWFDSIGWNDAEVPPARTTLLTGGWAGMASVRDARAEVLPDVSVSTRSQDTAYGAAQFATRLLTLIEI